MPKKSTTARAAAQRQKSRAQKSIELVRTQAAEELEQAQEEEESAVRVATATISPAPAPKSEIANSPVATAPKGSAAARIAARRQNTQKAQQRSAVALITPEHFAYVRRDLIRIAFLAVIMFAIIIGAYVIIGKGI